jgi:hypothetical protein
VKKQTSLFLILPIVLIGVTATTKATYGYYYQYPSYYYSAYYQSSDPSNPNSSYYYGYRHHYKKVKGNRHKRSLAKSSGESARGVGGLPGKIAAPGQREFIFSPRLRAWAAYDPSGTKLSGGTANGGNNYCPDIHRRCHTPVGAFRVLSKGSYGCISTRYPIKHIGGRIVRGGAHMPYCMYFTTNFAIHGYHVITNSNVSHGCIRVSNSAAEWLHSSFINVGTRVRVLPY